MSRYARHSPDEPPNHDWFAGQKRSDPRLCLKCGKNPKLPPLMAGGRVLFQSNFCRECEDAAAKEQPGTVLQMWPQMALSRPASQEAAPVALTGEPL